MATSTISNTVTDGAGTALSGIAVEIKLMPGGAFRTAAGSEVARIHRTTTDENGLWSAALERNADITPSGTYYEVVEKIPGAPRKWLFQVGSSNQTLFASLITVPPTVSTPTALTQEAGDARYVLAPGTFGGAPDITEVVGGQAADAGSEDSYARIDHRHPYEGYIICTSLTRPSSPADGEVIYETDTDFMHVYNGSAWQRIAHPGQWTTWLPTLAQGTSTDISKTTLYASYNRIGRTVNLRAGFAITGAGQSGQPITLSLPVNCRTHSSGAQHEVVGGGTYLDTGTAHYPVLSTVRPSVSVSLLYMLRSDQPLTDFFGTDPAMATANGDVMHVRATYEAASD